MASAMRCSAAHLQLSAVASTSSSSCSFVSCSSADSATINRCTSAAAMNSWQISPLRETSRASGRKGRVGRGSPFEPCFPRRRRSTASATFSSRASLWLSCYCELHGDGPSTVSEVGRPCLSSSTPASTSEKLNRRLLVEGVEQFRYGTGTGERLVSIVNCNVGPVDEIRRIIAKDRQWLEDVIGRAVDGARVDGGVWNWKKVLLIVVPGVSGLNFSGPQSVLEALGVLAAIITVHEAGHFLAARLQNIHVTKFSLGFGPTLAKYQRQGVEYSLRAFPFGGFVAFPDDDPNSEFPLDDPNLLKNRPILDRALVISAGVIANVIFAYSVLFVQTLGVGLLEREMLPGVVVPDVLSKSAASKAGMHAGDVILAVDGYKLSAKDSAVFDLVDTIKRNAGRPITLFVQRGDEIVGVKLIPDVNKDGSGRIGVQLSPNAKPHRVKAENLVDAAVKSGREFGRLTAAVVDGLKQIFFNFEKTVDSVSGPVAIVAVGAEVARSDIVGLYQFAAIVNINLAIVNLLPLPALDGGYLAFVLLEALRGGKKLPDGVEQGIMSSGVVLLLALGIVLMVRDTLNLGFIQQML